MKSIIAALLLFPFAAFAADKPVSSKYIDFSGGLNNETASIYLKDNESPDLLNVVIDEPMGQLNQRNGFALRCQTPSGKTPTNLFAHSTVNGARYLILTDNETVWQTDDCDAFTEIWTGLSADNLPRFATIRNNLWIVNGSTFPIVWDGTTASQLDGEEGRPAAPKAKYITFWRERVFLGNTPTDPSGVFFSALTSPAGAALNPATSPDAWTNTNNLIYFSRDDGNPIYGMKLYRDNIYVFKGTSGILRLVFNDEYTIGGINVTKTVSIIGSKFNESITEMDDGLLRFIGQDGAYLFDGSKVRRISTNWTSTFYSILQPGMGEAYSIWDSAAEWATGTGTNLVTTTKGHENSLSLPTVDYTNWSFESGASNWTVSGNASIVSTTDTDLGGEAYGTTVTGIIAGGSKLVEMDSELSKVYGGRSGFTINVTREDGSSVFYKSIYTDTIENGYKTGVRDNINLSGVTGKVRVTVTEMSYPTVGYVQSAYFDAGSVPGNKLPFGYAIGAQIVRVGSPFPTTTHVYGKVRFDLPTISSETPKVFYPLTGTWESANTESTSLSQWRLFDAISNNVDQTLTFEVKTAVDEAGLASAPYTVLTPGVTVSSTTNTWSKIKISASTTDNALSPYVDRIGINWVTGPQSKSTIVSANYRSRYWVSAATDTANLYNTMTMVESMSPLGTYTRYDLPITAYAIWNNRLYAGISNTDWIVELDTGTTDNGKTITSYWDSKDELYGSPVNYKSINKMVIDYLKTPDNPTLSIGLSNDMGQTFSYKSMDTGAESLTRNTRIINMDANRTLQFRSRVFNNTPGVGFNILGINTFGTMNDFTGN